MDNMNSSNQIPIPTYDIRRLPAYDFVAHYVRQCFEEIVERMNLRYLRVSNGKRYEMLCKLMAEEPRPLIDYIGGGGLRAILVEGKGRNMRLKWAPRGQYFHDAKPLESPYLKDILDNEEN